GAIARLTPALGALPLPSDVQGARDFNAAIKRRLGEGGVLAIYPESHVWPKCSFIRPFNEACFDMPRMYGVPIYTATRTYRRTALGYRTVVYIDGPFTPREELSKKEARDELMERIGAVMRERALTSDVEVYRYERKNKNE
ncbi:MAG: 1-acyl-sn-glycerol-3-phosphate acyltransferase, partial [Clostridia bacterium]|nr:1-acyl-sn-glycerol-3-phosphate acyltransferase [Clostridia bacterium]